MPQFFVYRSQAVADQQKRGHENFRTKYDTEVGMWTGWYEPSKSPAEGWQNFDFVNHVETEWDRTSDRPKPVGVVVVTCTLAEISDEELAAIKAQGHIIEPLTPSLFGKAGDDDKPARRSSTGGGSTRAKSDVESPVKVVWRLADEMVGANRKDVIAACIAAGVNKATANTQYYRWSKRPQEPK